MTLPPISRQKIATFITRRFCLVSLQIKSASLPQKVFAPPRVSDGILQHSQQPSRPIIVTSKTLYWAVASERRTSEAGFVCYACLLHSRWKHNASCCLDNF